MTSELRDDVCCPIVFSASMTTTSWPFSARRRAVARPMAPAPMTTASTSISTSPSIATARVPVGRAPPSTGRDRAFAKSRPDEVDADYGARLPNGVRKAGSVSETKIGIGLSRPFFKSWLGRPSVTRSYAPFASAQKRRLRETHRQVANPTSQIDSQNEA